ncbi:amidohydrolase 2 [Dentipellis sp. KUC8613]|nr:amidohydrolase 2 [Dentipellis sp. KUC8613]
MSSVSKIPKLLVDIHTHLYLPRYASLLRTRTIAPRILSRTTTSGQSEERLLILENEPSGGRPVGPQYWDRDEKLKFMDKHGIDISIVSTANPWLDFLPYPEALSLAKDLNTDLESYCATSPELASSPSIRRLYALGLLPLVPNAPPDALASFVRDLAANHPNIRGIIMGTRGIGKGLDDPALESMWAALAETGLVVFLHPHYGLSSGENVWGEQDNGHVLPLALGFPFETTAAVTRLILAGTLDRHPDLRILLAHAAGALPALSSRLSSCIVHDPRVAARLQHDARFYLGRLYYDAVAYGSAELEFVSATIGRADHFDSSSSVVVGKTAGSVEDKERGSARIMFGTDHPFFPPIEDGKEEAKWQSVVENLEAVRDVPCWSEEAKDGVRGRNALRIFGII